MSWYINSNDVYRILSNEAAHRILHSDGSRFDVGRSNGIIAARDIVMNIPPADGEIKVDIWRRMYSPYGELEGFIHEECGFSDTCAFNYCPSCGVKMDVEPARKNEGVANYEIIKKNVF
jgi:hypothetical protein